MVPAMLVNPSRITFSDGRAVNAHLDRWAAAALRDADQWQRVLEETRDWSDYSARNQLLLASYAAVGPVAGIETWRLVPAEGTGTCVVRSGEHAYPVRVPVTTTSDEPDPHLGGARPTSAAVAGWEWRGVFCLEQLARRPDPDAITRLRPDPILDPEGLKTAAVATARRTIRGRIPDDDPHAVLRGAAERMPRTSQRPAPTGVLAEQVAWLALDRVRPADGPVPAFDPSELPVRERWEAMLDVLDADRRLAAALGRHLEVDLLASPLPRMEVDDDRALPAARRNRLPRASVEQLPVGRWVEVGPYTPDEWAARGEDANGKGTYLRLNSTAYLVVIERGDRASWRLEDTRSKVGAGRLDGGDDANLDAAKAAANATLQQRYPQLIGRAPDLGAPIPTGARTGWEPVEGQPGALRHLHHGKVASLVIPAGDQWIPLVQRGPGLLPEAVGPALATREAAIERAEEAGRRALREGVLDTRVDLDTAVARLAASPGYSRDQLLELVAPRLATAEQAALVADPAPAEVAELLGAAGITSATTVAVLRAEGAPAHQVGPLLPILGIPPRDAIGALHQQWGIARTHAAELVGATPAEMRAAGCSPDEIIATRPRDVLSTLPARPDLWDLAGGTLATAGLTPDEIAGIVATHSPNPDCFAAGLAAAVDDGRTGIALAVRRGMPPEAIAALSERYGLTPLDTANALGDAHSAPGLAVGVIRYRCDDDPVLTTQIARSALGFRTDTVIAALSDDPAVELATVHQLREAPPLSRDQRALIAANHPPRPPAAPVLARSEARRLLASLPDPDDAAPSSGRGALLDALPSPDEVGGPRSLLDSLPDPDLSLELTEIDR